MKNTFEDLFYEISMLSSIDTATPSEMFCKFAEEFGELAQAINRTTGRKRSSGLSANEKRKRILEEGADCLQNLICVLDGQGITAGQLLNKLYIKNQKYKALIATRNVKWKPTHPCITITKVRKEIKKHKK